MQHHSLPVSGSGCPASSSKDAPVQAVGFQLFQENAVGDNVKGFPEVQVENIHSLSLIL